MSNHTPGPWIVVASDEYSGGYDLKGLTDNLSPEEEVANVALIAAAPDLLVACRHVMAWFDALKQQQHQELVAGQTLESASRNWATLWDKPVQSPLDLEVVAAAIAKAEGR